MQPNKQPNDVHISEWMERNGNPAINSEEIIFMKHMGSDFIMHGQFVDDMRHVPICAEFRDGFMTKYKKYFDITGGGLMETFLGMEVKQIGSVIKLHLDNTFRMF